MDKTKKRKGIWVPIELMENKDLDWPNKVLITEIISLHKLEKKCHASNGFFASLLGIDKSAASKRITQLKKMGYIQTEDIYEKKLCVGRIITPTFKKGSSNKPPKPQKKTGVSSKTIVEVSTEQEGSSISNHSVVPEQQEVISKTNVEVSFEQEDSSTKNKGVVPEQQGGSSQTTIGVVPERLGGSSYENPINTMNNTNILIQEIIQDNGPVTIFEPSDISSTQNPGLTKSISGENTMTEFPEEFYLAIAKHEKTGWMSLTAKEQSIEIKYRKEYKKIIGSQPNASE